MYESAGASRREEKASASVDSLFCSVSFASLICVFVECKHDFGEDITKTHHICLYRVVQKKGTVLLSTSLAWPAVAGCSRAETFSQLSSISFTQPCIYICPLQYQQQSNLKTMFRMHYLSPSQPSAPPAVQCTTAQRSHPFPICSAATGITVCCVDLELINSSSFLSPQTCPRAPRTLGATSSSSARWSRGTATGRTSASARRYSPVAWPASSTGSLASAQTS